jgi:ubiquinone/menaquinone biosynthesis C-methylase UbiE
MAKKEKIVEEGYDKIAEEYHARRHVLDNRKELEMFATMLPKGSKVLDVGCGAGVPVAKFLARAGFMVTGIDISERMVALARKNVPKATFTRKDMAGVHFKSNSFDGITAF